MQQTAFRQSVSAAVLLLGATVFANQAPGSEEVARRQLESGRSFARQGNYGEALKDFRAVADTHATTSVADNALLEIARYYFDIASDMKEAAAAVDTILKKYPTSDSAPDAYLIAGRLALARSRQSDDLAAALANFDRVHRLFPASTAVPAALFYAAETHYYGRRFQDALAHLVRITAEYPSSTSAADAYVAGGRALVAMGDPLLAMEELQQARNRWPKSPAAADALAAITLLHRLYVRAPRGPAFVVSTEAAGPAKLQNVVGLAASGRRGIYWATETGIGAAVAAGDEKAPPATRPQGLTVDTNGVPIAIEAAALRSAAGQPVSIALPQPNGSAKLLDRIVAAVQLSNGDWLVMDGGERVIHRFSRTGTYIGAFTSGRFTRLAINLFDEVAALDRDQKVVALFDAAGKPIGKLPFKGAGYVLENPEDLAFDAFGHLYVLDRTALAVFSPFAAAAAAGAPPAAPAPAAPGALRLVTLFSPTEKDPGAFRRGSALALDASGGAYIYDERAQRILVYR